MTLPILATPRLDLPPVTWPGVWLGLAILVGGILLALLAKRLVRVVTTWRGRGPSSARVFGRLVAWLIGGLAFGAALTIAFPSVRPVDILGGVGVISIAAGIAFQTVLGNMFAGIVILVRDRFRVGDQIRVGDKAGTVVSMGLTGSEIRTFDGRLVLVPNSILHSEIITIQTGFENVRSTVALDIDEGADLDVACRVALHAMSQVPDVLPEPAPQALLTRIGTATVRLELRFWSGARQLDTLEAQHAVILRVMTKLAEAHVATGSDVHVVEAGPGLTSVLSAREGRPVRRTPASPPDPPTPES